MGDLSRDINLALNPPTQNTCSFCVLSMSGDTTLAIDPNFKFDLQSPMQAPAALTQGGAGDKSYGALKFPTHGSVPPTSNGNGTAQVTLDNGATITVEQNKIATLPDGKFSIAQGTAFSTQDAKANLGGNPLTARINFGSGNMQYTATPSNNGLSFSNQKVTLTDSSLVTAAQQAKAEGVTKTATDAQGNVWTFPASVEMNGNNVTGASVQIGNGSSAAQIQVTGGGNFSAQLNGAALTASQCPLPQNPTPQQTQDYQNCARQTDAIGGILNCGLSATSGGNPANCLQQAGAGFLGKILSNTNAQDSSGNLKTGAAGGAAGQLSDQIQKTKEKYYDVQDVPTPQSAAYYTALRSNDLSKQAIAAQAVAPVMQAQTNELNKKCQEIATTKVDEPSMASLAAQGNALTSCNNLLTGNLANMIALQLQLQSMQIIAQSPISVPTM